MTRAEVWRHSHERYWRVCTWPDEIPDRDIPITSRLMGDVCPTPFPTHSAALAHALAEVGLAPKENPHA